MEASELSEKPDEILGSGLPVMEYSPIQGKKFATSCHPIQGGVGDCSAPSLVSSWCGLWTLR